jgi:hypothetical protein
MYNIKIVYISYAHYQSYYVYNLFNVPKKESCGIFNFPRKEMVGGGEWSSGNSFAWSKRSLNSSPREGRDMKKGHNHRGGLRLCVLTRAQPFSDIAEWWRGCHGEHELVKGGGRLISACAWTPPSDRIPTIQARCLVRASLRGCTRLCVHFHFRYGWSISRDAPFPHVTFHASQWFSMFFWVRLQRATKYLHVLALLPRVYFFYFHGKDKYFENLSVHIFCMLKFLFSKILKFILINLMYSFFLWKV